MSHIVYLTGDMAEKFGVKHPVAHNTYEDIVKTIHANHPGFREYLINMYETRIGLDISIEGESLKDLEELINPLKPGDITLTAVPWGSGFSLDNAFDGIKEAVSSVWDETKKVVGPVLTIAAVAMGVAFLGPMVGSGLMSMGSSALSAFIGQGLQGMLTQALYGTVANYAYKALGPKMGGAGPETANIDSNNYLYQGANTSRWQEGNPIPVLYGELRVPGIPVQVDSNNFRQLHQPMIPSLRGDLDYYSKGGF